MDGCVVTAFGGVGLWLSGACVGLCARELWSRSRGDAGRSSGGRFASRGTVDPDEPKTKRELEALRRQNRVLREKNASAHTPAQDRPRANNGAGEEATSGSWSFDLGPFSFGSAGLDVRPQFRIGLSARHVLEDSARPVPQIRRGSSHASASWSTTPHRLSDCEEGDLERRRTFGSRWSSSGGAFHVPNAELLDTLIKAAWPFISEWFQETMRQRVEPLLRRLLPTVFDAFGERCHLGTKPPRLENVVATTVLQHNSTAVEDITNVRVVGDLAYHGDCEIDLVFSAGKILLNSLSVHGVVVVELVKLVTKPPWFSGIRIHFPNAPDVDIEVDSTVLGVSFPNFGFVKNKIVEAITQVIARHTVLPNRFAVKLVRGLDIFHLRHPRPQGVLRLAIMRAEGLGAYRRNASADPCVEVTIGAETWRSPAVPTSLSPSWGEDAVHDFFVTDCLTQLFRVEVLDDDYSFRTWGKQTDFLGCCEVNIAELVDDSGAYEPTEVSLELESWGGTGDYGTLVLRAQWRPFASESEASEVVAATPALNRWGLGAPHSSCWMLFVDLHHVTGLPPCENGTQHWALVSVKGASEDAQASDLSFESPSAPAYTPVQEAMNVLRGFGLPPEVVADCIECDAATLRAQLLHRGESAQAKECDPTGADLVDVSWDCPFCFLLDSVASATVTVTVMRPAAGKERRNSHAETSMISFIAGPRRTEDTIGSASFRLCDLLTQPQLRSSVLLPLEVGADPSSVDPDVAGAALLKLQLQVKPLQPPPATAPAPLTQRIMAEDPETFGLASASRDGSPMNGAVPRGSFMARSVSMHNALLTREDDP